MKARSLGATVAGAIVMLSGAGAFTASASPSATAPYSDPAAAGTITLCDAQGHAITSGSTSTAPFVWTAHSSFVPPPAYSKPGRTAFLLAYQPRQNVPAGSWSGGLLSAASRYDDAAHPTVQFTKLDDALNQFTSSYPPQWNGLIQLRMYYGAPDEPTYSLRYAASDLLVSSDGGTWTSLDPGPSSACDTGKATSVATILGVRPDAAHHEATNTLDQLRPAAVPSTRAAGHPVATSGGHSPSALAPTGPPLASAVSPAVRAAVTSSPSSSHRGLTLGIVLAAVAMGAGGYLVGRRRSAT
jgi:hypothetical protein